MKIIILAVLAVLVVVPCYGQVSYSPSIIDMKPAAGGWVPVTPASVPMTRNVPVLVRSGVLNKVLLSKLNVAGLVMLSTSMMYEAIKENPQAFPQMMFWLNRMGVGVNPGSGYIRRYPTASPNAESDVEACVSRARAEAAASIPSYPGTKEYIFSTQAQKSRMEYELRFLGVCSEVQVASNNVYCASGSGTIRVSWQKIAGLSNFQGYSCPEAGQTVVILYDPASTWPLSEYTETLFTAPQSDPVAQRTAQRDLETNPNNVPADARKGLDEALNNAADAIKNNTDMLQKNANSTEKLGDKLQQIMKNGIPSTTLTNMQTTSEGGASGDDLTEPYQAGENLTSSGGGSGGSGSNAVCGAPPLPPCEVTGNWNDTQGAPSDLSNHNLDPNENANVVGSTSELVSEQRDVLAAFLNQIWQAVNRLVSKIMVEVNRWIGDQQAGSCSVAGANVFGGSFDLDFCQIDLSAWRQVIIAVFGMLSAIILVTKWRS